MIPSVHDEHHFTATDVVRDIVIGMSDGLTVPFALAAGISGAVSSTRVVVAAGLAEIAAGSIAMGLGGYLAARGDLEHYESERRREELEIVEKTDAEIAETEEVLEAFGLTREESAPIVKSLQARPEAWVDFMMRFELGLEKPEARRALASGMTIAVSYVVGGLIPLVPYMFARQNTDALTYSIVSTLLALAVFGFIKARFTGTSPWRGAAQTTLIGGLAAAVAYMLAKAVS